MVSPALNGLGRVLVWGSLQHQQQSRSDRKRRLQFHFGLLSGAKTGKKIWKSEIAAGIRLFWLLWLWMPAWSETTTQTERYMVGKTCDFLRFVFSNEFMNCVGAAASVWLVLHAVLRLLEADGSCSIAKVDSFSGIKTTMFRFISNSVFQPYILELVSSLLQYFLQGPIPDPRMITFFWLSRGLYFYKCYNYFKC